MCNDQSVSLLEFVKVGFQNSGFLNINSMLKPILWFYREIELIIVALEHASCGIIVHASYRLLFSTIFYLTMSMQSALGFSWFFCLLSLFCLSFLLFSIMVRKTKDYRTSSSSSTPSFDSERFLSVKNQETYKKLNILRNVWVEWKVVLYELDSEIRRNFVSRG